MKNNRSDIIIDLTSLLDVIFIILLVVLCNQFLLNKELEDKMGEAESVTASGNAIIGAYSDQIDTLENIGNYVFSVSIYSYYSPADIKSRTIKVLALGEEPFDLSLYGEDTEEVYSKLKEKLILIANEHSNMPVIISLNEDDENILYRDEQAIMNILEDLLNTEGCSNVYVKGSIKE